MCGVVLIPTPLSRISCSAITLAKSRRCPVRRTPELGRNRLARRDVGGGGVLAQLQRPDVGGNAPAITRRNLGGIILHDAVSVGHHVEEIADRSFPQPLDVIGRRLAREAARWDEAVAVAHAGVARRAVNIEALRPRSSTSSVTGKGMYSPGSLPILPV